MDEQLTFGSLFAGIGGFDLGFERAGMRDVWQVEINLFCQKILKKHFPSTTLYGDIRTIDGDELEYVNVMCGGFPCQDVSLAGDRAGLAGERSGLWFEYLRLIRHKRPRWVVGENVFGLLSSNAGRDFGTILRGLSECGYSVTWNVLHASDVGAPHRRKRLFIVANCDSERVKGFWQKPIQRVEAFSWSKGIRGVADLRNRPDLPEPLIRRIDDGLSARVDALGNAVVPQITEWIAKRIIEIEKEQTQ